MSENSLRTETPHSNDELIEQDHHRGPGWFLKIAYVVISLFCIYYLFAHWDWKSDYELAQEQIEASIAND